MDVDQAYKYQLWSSSGEVFAQAALAGSMAMLMRVFASLDREHDLYKVTSHNVVFHSLCPDLPIVLDPRKTW
jgi:hypothetical protein